MESEKYSAFGKLTKDFLSNKLSAAGISNIVSEKHKKKKILWTFLLLFTMATMSYMTYKIIQEYLTYPKLLIKESIFNTYLDFPAVTICPLNTIPSIHVENSSVNPLWKLQNFVENLELLSINHTIEETCYDEPLCEWSYFLGRCQCLKSPCELQQCSPIDKEKCLCPATFCEIMGSSACQFIEPEEMDTTKPEDDDEICVCRINVTTTATVQQNVNKYAKQAIKKIGDPEIKERASLIVYSQTNDLTDIYTQLLPNLRDLYKFGADYSRFILSCSYDGAACDKRNFTIFYHIIYGKCYMFNYLGPNNTEKGLGSANIGSASGLHVLMDVSPNEKLKLLTPEIGARVTIHDPRLFPFIAEDGFNVADEMSGIEITLTNVSRLGEPWGKCNSTPNYNQLGCQKGFTGAKILEICKCGLRTTLNGIIFAGPIAPNKTVFKFCKLNDIVDAECVKNVTRDIERKRYPYECPPVCFTKSYSASITGSTANRMYYEKIRFIKNMKPHREGIGTLPKTLGGIKVYFTTQKTQIHREIPTYSWDTLLANIGGNLGFFMGLSIVTFFQVAEFLWDVLWTACTVGFKVHRRKCLSRVSPNSIQEDKHLRFPYNRYHMRR